MYVIEITEDKMDGIMSHLGKAAKCINKVAECFENMKESSHHEDYEHDDEEYMEEDMEPQHRSRHRMGGRSPRYRDSGRYSRY